MLINGSEQVSVELLLQLIFSQPDRIVLHQPTSQLIDPGIVSVIVLGRITGVETVDQPIETPFLVPSPFEMRTHDATDDVSFGRSTNHQSTQLGQIGNSLGQRAMDVVQGLSRWFQETNIGRSVQTFLDVQQQQIEFTRFE